MDVGRFFRIIRSRAGLILTIFLLTVATTAAVSFLMPKRYFASTTLMIDLKSTDPVLGNQVMTPQTVAGYLSTQVDVIKSDRVIQRVIDELKLDQDPWFRAEWQKQTEGRGDIRKWIHELLLESLNVVPSREGSTITISYEGGSPQGTADLVNAFATGYVQTSLSLKTEPTRDYAQRFEEQVKTYREEVERAQSKLSRFAQSTGITSADERFDIENSRLQELSTQLVQVQAAASEARSRRDAITRQGRDSLPEVVANPLIQTLKADIGRAEARLQEMSSRLGANHPQLQAAQAEVAGLRSRLDNEIGKVAGSIVASSSVNAQRESEIRAALEAQREKVLKLRKARDELAVLQREVESAQKAYDLVSQRMMQTNIESQARMSDVSVLSPAVPPVLPSQPKPLLNVAIGLFLGLLLGLFAAMTMEVVQRPLRTTEDVLDVVGVPVLAVLPPSSSRRAQRLIGSTGPTVGPPTLRLGN